MKNFIIVMLFTFSGANGFTQVCYPIDQTFGTAGVAIGNYSLNQSYGNDIFVQPDNKIVQVSSLSDGLMRFGAIRYKSNGQLDSTFGTNGKVIISIGNGESYSNAGLIQPDGKIIVAGTAYNGSDMDFALVRLNSDGSLDNSFGTNGKLITPVGLGYDYINSLAIQPDGKIVAVGSAAPDSSFIPAFAIVRYNNNGSIDNTFGNNGKIISHMGHLITYLGNVYYGVYSYEYANAVIIQPDGKIIVGGDSYTHTGCYDYYGGVYCNPAFAMVRYNSNGTVDNSFGNNGKVVDSVSLLYCSAAILQSDGKILVTGYGGWATNGFITNRYNSDGNLDNSFGVNGKAITVIGQNNQSYASSIYYQPDGKILVAGNTNFNTIHDFVVVRYNANGIPDNSFSNTGIAVFHVGSQGSYDWPTGLALQGNKIIVGGNISHNGTYSIVTVRLQDNAPLISPAITPSGTIAICQGSYVVLSSSETGSIQWFNNSLPINGATNANYTATTNGSYTVRVSNANGCGTSSAVIVNVNNNPPKPPLSYEGSPYRFVTTAGYNGYRWYFNDVLIAGASVNTYTPTQTGLYKVQVNDANQCSTTSDPFNLVALGIADIIIGDVTLRFYPNPAQTVFYVDIPQPTNRKLIAELYELSGRLLKKQLLTHSHNEISVSNLPAGLYQLVITNNKEKAIRKIIVLK